jgi:hypothetical protein
VPKGEVLLLLALVLHVLVELLLPGSFMSKTLTATCGHQQYLVKPQQFTSL